jgi:hypothetical protein
MGEEPERRRRRLRPPSSSATPPAAPADPAAVAPGPPVSATPAAEAESAQAETSAVLDPVEEAPKPAARPPRAAVTGRPARPANTGRPVSRPTSGAGAGGDDQSERGLRGLVGSGSSQVSVGAALRARDAARPTEQQLAEADTELVIVRRNWMPREDLPRNR